MARAISDKVPASPPIATHSRAESTLKTLRAMPAPV